MGGSSNKFNYLIFRNLSYISNFYNYNNNKNCMIMKKNNCSISGEFLCWNLSISKKKNYSLKINFKFIAY
jgi:hypothetical protein